MKKVLILILLAVLISGCLDYWFPLENYIPKDSVNKPAQKPASPGTSTGQTPGETPGEIVVNSFRSCVRAGNPVMESYPRQCMHEGRTYVEQIPDDDTVGLECTFNSHCETPASYLIQSNCPFTSACIDNECRVICPLCFSDPNPAIHRTYPVECISDQDCDCSERGSKTIDCLCNNNQCISVEA